METSCVQGLKDINVKITILSKITKIQCNPYQNPNGSFHKNTVSRPKIHIEHTALGTYSPSYPSRRLMQEDDLSLDIIVRHCTMRPSWTTQ